MDHEISEDEPDVKALASKIAAIMACEILRWVIRDGKAKPPEIKLRSHVAIWMMCPEFESITQVEMAQMTAKVIGKGVKQHLGRPIADFQQRFGFKRATMQSDSAHAKAFEREQAKREKRLAAEANELEELAQEAKEFQGE